MFSISPLSIHTTAACDVIHVHMPMSVWLHLCASMCLHACVLILCAFQYEAKECVLLFLQPNLYLFRNNFCLYIYIYIYIYRSTSEVSNSKTCTLCQTCLSKTSVPGALNSILSSKEEEEEEEKKKKKKKQYA
jgi:hypothetical protein